MRRRSIDRRLNWRDPNMPVLRPWEWPDGSVGIREVPAEEEREYCASVVDKKPGACWKDDPSYNWARPGARKRRI